MTTKNTNEAAVVADLDLPPLPEPSPTHFRQRGMLLERMEMYTADQVREAQRSAVVAALARSAAPASAASLPDVAMLEHLREFVQASVKWSILEHEDEDCCRACSGLAVWNEAKDAWDVNHRPECSVLRAEALLAARPAEGSAQVATHEARRWCKGDAEWTNWTPISEEQRATYEADETFEVRPIAASERSDTPAALDANWQAAIDEVARATLKFPTWPTDPLHAVAVLGEEFGELTKAVLQTAYEPHKVQNGELRTEAIQTAAMALRFLASLDRYEFTQCHQHKQGMDRIDGDKQGAQGDA